MKEDSPFESKKAENKWVKLPDEKVESDFYKVIKRVMSAFPIEMQRLENSLDLGTPDVGFTTRHNTGFIELKRLTSVPRWRFTVPYRPGQWGWLSRFSNIRPQSVFVLIYLPNRTMICIEGDEIRKKYEMIDCRESKHIHIIPVDPHGFRELYRVLDGEYHD